MRENTSGEMMSNLLSDSVAKRRRTLMIVDDHPIVRRGVADLLARELDFEVAGRGRQRRRCTEGGGGLSPRSGRGGYVAQRQQWDRVDHPDQSPLPRMSKPSSWSMFDEKVFAERALQAGAMGYVNKKEPIENLVCAVRQVLQGNIYLSPQMTNRLLHRACGGGEHRMETRSKGCPTGNWRSFKCSATA